MKTFRVLRVFLFLVILAAVTVSGQQQGLAIVGADVVNPRGKPSYPNATILIAGNRILQVGPSSRIQVPEGYRIIDARGKWVIPGLIDAHIHFFQSGGLYTRPDILDLRKYVPYEQEQSDIRKYLTDTFARYLRCGVTGVVDMGGPFWNFEVRARADTTLLAPRVVLTGPLISTYQPEKLMTDDPPIIKIHKISEARSLVEKEVAAGADFIKIWYIVRPGQKAEEHYPLVQAVIQESHQAGQRVAVHATQLQTAKLAVKAGADILVHSVNDREVDSEFIRLLKEHRILYIPTLSVFERYREVLTRQMHFSAAEILLANPHFLGTLFQAFEIPQTDFPTFSAEFVRARQQQNQIARENLKRLHDAGVWIAAGTDAGNIGTLHGPAIFREFQLMQEASLTPHQILTCATLNGARVMGMEGELGSVEPGKLADLLILNSDPRRQLPDPFDYFAIIKDGHLFWPQEILHPSPGEVVQIQTNAYNARDMEAFLTTFSDTVKAYSFPNRVRFTNRREMEEHYLQLFQSAPQLHAQVQSSTVLGNFVVNREHITGLPDGSISDVIVIYDVRDEKIQRLWFLGE